MIQSKYYSFIWVHACSMCFSGIFCGLKNATRHIPWERLISQSVNLSIM